MCVNIVKFCSRNNNALNFKRRHFAGCLPSCVHPLTFDGDTKFQTKQNRPKKNRRPFFFYSSFVIVVIYIFFWLSFQTEKCEKPKEMESVEVKIDVKQKE